MNFKKQYIFAFICFISIQLAFSQKKDENIGTEVVNVVKPYTPTISDAFKVKETPPLEDEDNAKKQPVEYNIFSFPVASTFTPSKGKAAGVDKTKQEQLYKNFATLGVGNYLTVNAELFVTEDVSDNAFVAGMFRHLSSEGGIDGVLLDDSFRDSSLDLTYGLKSDGIGFNVDAGYQNQGYNWYGVPEDLTAGLDNDERRAFLNNISPQHTYSNAYIGSKVTFNESVFNEVSIKYNRFSDSYDSQENRLFLRPDFSVDINNTTVKTKIIVDYVGGSFNKDYTLGESYKYGFTNVGIHPSFNMVRDDWSINVGAAAFYSMDIENSDNNFYLYPQINASYNVVGDLMIFYAGAEGTLEQNSYRDFTNSNPYVSPTLGIAPTDRQYDIFAGLKGKLASSVSYNLRASYVNERNRALFLSNNFTLNTSAEDYAFGNSFSVVYDDMRTISFFGELKADFTKNIAFGINGTFASYSVDNQAEAWNLPAIRVATSLDVNITEQWYAGTDIFYVGERKDAQQNIAFTSSIPTYTIDGYFDANAHVGYKYSDRLTGFLKFNNIANQMYEKWLNYQVQGFQVILGASYKFDF